ncbi:MAG: hypothetical protein AAF715_28090 [Myxococcota bacterium]
MNDDGDALSTPAPGGARAKGRRIAFAVYLSSALAIALACAVQITEQTFFAEAPAAPLPFETCEEGIHELYAAVERGRTAADERTRQGRDRRPEAALYHFRERVTPVWAHRRGVAELCGPAHRRLLDALDRLRYSEEHVVRHQAAELTTLRHRVRDLVDASDASTAEPED